MATSDGLHHIELLNGEMAPLAVRRSARARRISLRIDPAGGQVVLTLPEHVGIGEGLAFAEQQSGWISGRLATLPPRVRFDDGAKIPILGETHVIRHEPGARAGVWRASGTLWVSGAEDFIERRVSDFLKAEARREIRPRTQEKYARLSARQARPLGRVTLRDTSSRWGSCSPRGDLNFSWRLVLAPESVLDYVVAHEVAHLAHMDHSPRFWKVCAELTETVEEPRRWLRRNAARLLRYG
jgi:predicted metal-dependent hydrolase